MGKPQPPWNIHQMAEEGDLTRLEVVIEAGVPVDARDERGRTPLMAATHANQPNAFRWLLNHGADVDIQDDLLDNPFLYSGAEGLMEILVQANEAGADPAIYNRYGGTALIPACERGHVEIVEYLLEHSAVDVNHVNKLGWTGLLEAIILSDGGPPHQQIVQLLIDYGADVNIADFDGVTPLAHSRNRGFAEIASMLESAGGKL